nr:hypothetical protein [uncultured Desulfobacter sp.]
MENTIGDGAIKIACIQCIPGSEWQVKDDLKKACSISKNIKDFTFLKGIGSFDIILVYWTEDFGSQLREAGPIDNILKSNLFLCYPYSYKNAGSIFEDLKSKTYTSFCLLKICPSLKNIYPEIDKSIRSMMAGDAGLSLIGSLGWNELIILYSSDDLTNIYRHLIKTNGLEFKAENIKISAILKTLSFVAINYQQLPSFSTIKKGFSSILKDLSNKPFFDFPITPIEKDNNSPTIEITASIIYLKKVENFFRKKGFRTSYLIGKHDILVTHKEADIKWCYFLAVLLAFRHTFSGKIFSTNTRINFCTQKQFSNGSKNLPITNEPFKFDYPKLNQIFGKEMASNLSNLFYTLNSLIQNPLTGNLYANMAQYPDYVYTVGEASFDSGNDNHNFALASSFVIRRGAELRSYGTYDTIEEVTGRFSEFKGGCQTSLVAIELLPYFILETINQYWYGFITVSGEPQFSHINEVLNVTSESIWNPQKWWAIYHEIGHIVTERIPTIADENLPAIKDYLSKSPLHEYDDVIEFSAEIIGFEIGFFGDFELYLKLLWTYLYELNQYQNYSFSKYAIRSFVIEIFEGRFRRYANVPRVTKHEFNQLDLLYSKFLSHMDKIETIVGEKIFPDKHFIAAENVKLLRDIYPFCAHLSKELSELKIRPMQDHLKSKNTKKIVSDLFQGKIWWEKIISPQAVLFHLLKKDRIEFNTKVSTVMSFWNQQSLKTWNK